VSVLGNDAAAGSMAAPFATPQRGVLACRAQRARMKAAMGVGSSDGPTPCIVTLREGRYTIKPGAPLSITAEDAFLTVRSFEGEQAELTGAVPLQGLVWAPATHNGSGASNVAIWAARER
jgi:hypothetical protein